MSHRKDTNGQTGMTPDEEAWKHVAAASEWEADTHVMPPEYSRQLLEISRQLKQAR